MYGTLGQAERLEEELRPKKWSKAPAPADRHSISLYYYSMICYS